MKTINNILNNKKSPFVIALFSFIVLNIYIGINFYLKSNYQENFIRLHVIANSNDISDQIIKFKVDEKINEYISTLNLDKNYSKKEILNILNENSDNFIAITNNILNENNINYGLKLKIGKIKYEEKDNMIYNMPSGTYDSVNIILGNGNGKNIWSIIFPNEDNINKLKNYESILPGISNIYETEEKENKSEKQYSSKLVEIINNIMSAK